MKTKTVLKFIGIRVGAGILGAILAKIGGTHIDSALSRAVGGLIFVIAFAITIRMIKPQQTQQDEFTKKINNAATNITFITTVMGLGLIIIINGIYPFLHHITAEQAILGIDITIVAVGGIAYLYYKKCPEKI